MSDGRDKPEDDLKRMLKSAKQWPVEDRQMTDADYNHREQVLRKQAEMLKRGDVNSK